MARDSWTDERLEDLNGRVDTGFGETREEFRALRSETREEFQAVRTEMREEFQAVRGEMREGFQDVRGELKEMRGEMAASRRSFTQAAGAIWVTSMVGFLSVIATILATQT